LYAAPGIIRVIKSRGMDWARLLTLIVEVRNAYKVFVRKPEAKRPFGRPTRRWEDK
jgi:hypothetical protein